MAIETKRGSSNRAWSATESSELARTALIADGEQPGEYQGSVPEGECAYAHYFDADLPGYRGWHWCVIVADAPDGEPTVSEVVLLPGDSALLAPQWVPWTERIAPGDLGPGDQLAAPPEDPRLVPNQIDTRDINPFDRDEIGQVAGELGLGRRRLLSYDGRLDAADRWHAGEFGPDAPMARQVQHSCADCGFYLPLAGALHVTFGACANEYSADGRVVAADYGCGAHSDVKAPSGEGSPAYEAYDDGAVEVVRVRAEADVVG